MQVDELTDFLAHHAPFDALDNYARSTLAEAAELTGFAAGEVVFDGFTRLTGEVWMVLAGRVDLWNQPDLVTGPAEERLGPGELFGFSAMLTERPLGPLAIAVGPARLARFPGAAMLPAFSSPRGARFLAEEVSSSLVRVGGDPRYGVVDELIVRPPFVVEPDEPVSDVARSMTERGVRYAAVRLAPGRFGLVTDHSLRRRILVDGLPVSTPAREVMDLDAPTARLGDSAAEALIQILDRDADLLLVTDATGELRGMVEPRDFVVSTTTAGVSLNEQLRRADTVDQLIERAQRIPTVLGDLLGRGLAADKVIAVHAALRDTSVRRAIALVFAGKPDLSVDAFTWLSLGSNGRREAVLTSDMDSAAAFDDHLEPKAIRAYRLAFAEVNALLAASGLHSDENGVSTQQQLFARTNADWRAAGLRWLDKPAENQGAIMTSLLVDGRPVHGDPGLPAVTQVFSDLRRHPQTMRLLLLESLSKRAKLRSVRDVLTRRADTFDIKTHALLPIVNIARWAGLSVGSGVLPTVDRLRVAAGSAILPTAQAERLVEVFGVLQRQRLAVQLEQVRDGQPPSDLVRMDQISPLDRSVIAQAVREISSVQRRMDNIAVYVPADGWSAPESS